MTSCKPGPIKKIRAMQRSHNTVHFATKTDKTHQVRPSNRQNEGPQPSESALIPYQVCRNIRERLDHPAFQLPDIPQFDCVVHRPRSQQVAVLIERDRRHPTPLEFC